MEHKANAVKEALHALTALETSLSSDERIDEPPILATKLNSFQIALSEMFQEGRSMDAAALTNIPIQLYEVLDQPIGSNPDLYLQRILQETNQQAEELKQKLVSLATIKRGVEDAISSNNNINEAFDSKGAHVEATNSEGEFNDKAMDIS